MADPQQPQAFCPNCRGGNPQGALQCQWCGFQLQAPQVQVQQPIYIPVPQPVVVQKKSAAPAIVGGCVILVLLACAGLFGLGMLGSSVSRQQTEQVNGAATPGALPGLDTPVNVGSWKVAVEKTELARELDWSGFGNKQTAKGIYLLVYVDAQNVTAKTDSINSFDYKVLDSAGAKYDSCSEFACFSYPDRVNRDSFHTDVPPRTESHLLAIFDVAPDAKGLVLQIEDNTLIALGDPPTAQRSK